VALQLVHLVVGQLAVRRSYYSFMCKFTIHNLRPSSPKNFHRTELSAFIVQLLAPPAWFIAFTGQDIFADEDQA